MVLKLSKIVSFLHFFVDVSSISKAVIDVYAYAFEGSRFALFGINIFGIKMVLIIMLWHII